MRICIHYAGQFWVSMIRSPYRRVCLGTIFTVLPLSAGIAAYNLSPSGAEEEARSRQVMIEVPLAIPAISEQIDVVTSHRPQATHTTMIRRNDTLAAIFSRLNVSDADATRFIRQQRQMQVLANPREGVYVQAKVTADRKLQSLKVFLEARNSKEKDTVLTMTRHGEKRFTLESDPFVYETQQAMSAGVIKTTLEDALETLEEAVRLLREDPRKAQGVLEHEVTLTYAKLNYAVNTAYDGPAALETAEDDNELTAWPKCMPFALPAKDADSEPSA